jgi:hypothetical protein
MDNKRIDSTDNTNCIMGKPTGCMSFLAKKLVFEEILKDNTPIFISYPELKYKINR